MLCILKALPLIKVLHVEMANELTHIFWSKLKSKSNQYIESITVGAVNLDLKTQTGLFKSLSRLKKLRWFHEYTKHGSSMTRKDFYNTKSKCLSKDEGESVSAFEM